MIDSLQKNAIRMLYQQGQTIKHIARLMNLDPKTVHRAIYQQDQKRIRSDKQSVDEELLKKLYQQCRGYRQRMWEILNEEYKINISYSTLTRLMRELSIGQKKSQRCFKVEDLPGDEMQQDTSPYKIKIGGSYRKVICSGLYLRYSKMRYVRFYLSFNRFKMKSFFHEALTFWGYSAKRCIIDNTNLAVLHGTGSRAVFHPGMESFAKNYGFHWQAHEIGHANRKAGTERNFWTVETNFFPGRSFRSLEDLNKQAFQWATERYARRPLSKTKLIPVELFEHEKTYLGILPEYIHPPYEEDQRKTDQYGYIEFNANYYWVPGHKRAKVKVLEYPHSITIYPPDAKEYTYDKKNEDIRGEKCSPQGQPSASHQPNNRKKTYEKEEQWLRSYDVVCNAYLDFIISPESRIVQKGKFTRDLYLLAQKMSPALFIKTIQRALKYQCCQIASLERISRKHMNGQSDIETTQQITHDYINRPTYQKGKLSKETEYE
ncbi:MAG: transposase [Calditrichaeota bacterium]|nr:transposase [Calditrichota bacterium]